MLPPVCLIVLVSRALCVVGWMAVGETRPVRTRQGDLKGLILAPDHGGLTQTRAFLGVPYATAERFMPPSSPPRWTSVREATLLGPVCPQVLAPIGFEPTRSSNGRLVYLSRLHPYLRNQSEDCLNLNIYSPSPGFPGALGGPARLPVMVFIHGESFSWNSGNPYDGSTLASYGNLIVVTINFRLGILGFLKTTNEPRTIANFGLLDQIAALRWIKDNIAAFGGNPAAITVIGHHTGAISVNYLMLSPVTQADKEKNETLFQRAIMMSGTALSSWAESRKPDKIARSLGEALRCPEEGDLAPCLRRKRLSELLSVRLPEDPAPILDGVVVVSHPRDLMSHNTDLFTRYDLLCGVTESESYHTLDSISLAHGLLEEERKMILSNFFQNNFETDPELAQTKAAQVYGLDRIGSPLEARDATLTLLSDARVVAPMVHTATFHSTPGREFTTYMYVFSHRSKYSQHPYAEQSVQGEDLAYVFGIPLGGGVHHLQGKYSEEEQLLSEAIMSMWTNFAKTGNPNKPDRENYLTLSENEWIQYDIGWPPYDPISQAYYKIEIPPNVEYKYRDNLSNFWNDILPRYLRKQQHGGQPDISMHRYPPKLVPRIPEFRGEDGNSRDPDGPDWSMFSKPRLERTTRKPVYGVVRMKPTDNKPPMDASPPTTTESEEIEDEIHSASSFTLSLVIFIGICFILINLLSFLFLWFQKKKLEKEKLYNTRFIRASSASLPDIEFDKKEEKCEIKSILKSNERLYDPLKVKDYNLGKWAGMYSQGSSSTVTIDPHTKVSQWINREKGSVGSRQKTDKSSDTPTSAATTSRLSAVRKVKKISVAVDATPNARSASVLKQTPIELTKSMDFGKRRLEAFSKPSLQRSTAVDSEDLPEAPNHSHSVSDPVQLLSTDVLLKTEEKNLKTFDPNVKDINVTSREEMEERYASHEEALDNIKRRNFPKVLPDFPEVANLLGENTRAKRMSLPVPTPSVESQKKVPPPPPPRITTTINRRQGTNRNSIPNFMSNYSQLQLSEETSDKVEKKPEERKQPEKKEEKKIEKRPEPRVIIKPTLTDPNLKKGVSSKIPRVTHQPDREPTKKQSKVGKQGAKNKVQPSKKSVSTETTGNTSGTSGSSICSVSTVRKTQKD